MGVPQYKVDSAPPRYDALEGVDTAFYVWKARPLADFPWYQRWIIRWLSSTFGWSTGDTMEGLAICRTEVEAREIARQYKGGNAQEFPVATRIEESLPDKVVQFGRRLPNDPDAERYYAKHRLPMVAIPRALIERAEKVLRRT